MLTSAQLFQATVLYITSLKNNVEQGDKLQVICNLITQLLRMTSIICSLLCHNVLLLNTGKQNEELTKFS